jgi:hypothetical protein
MDKKLEARIARLEKLLKIKNEDLISADDAVDPNSLAWFRLLAKMYSDISEADVVWRSDLARGNKLDLLFPGHYNDEEDLIKTARFYIKNAIEWLSEIQEKFNKVYPK